MTITPLISLAGAAGATLAGATVGVISNSPFAKLFSGDKSQGSPGAQSSSSDQLGSLAALEQSARDALAEFQQLLGPKLAELGVALAQPLKLAVDSFGKIRETSGHPQAQEIEALLAKDDQLSRSFRQASANLEAARAGREQEQFAALYQQNPELANQVYEHLFDNRRGTPQLSIRVDDQSALPLFE